MLSHREAANISARCLLRGAAHMVPPVECALLAPLAVIPPGVGPGDSFRDEGRDAVCASLEVLLDGKNR